MQLSDITAATVSAVAGRLVRRLAAATAVVLFALVALYHFTSAGLVALQMNFGLLQALLIVGAAYAAAAAVLRVTLFATRRKTPITGSAPGTLSSRNMQITMLLEAVMLGYMLANKTGRTRHER